MNVIHMNAEEEEIEDREDNERRRIEFRDYLNQKSILASRTLAETFAKEQAEGSSYIDNMDDITSVPVVSDLDIQDVSSSPLHYLRNSIRKDSIDNNRRISFDEIRILNRKRKSDTQLERRKKAKTVVTTEDNIGLMSSQCSLCKAKHWLFEKSSGTKEKPVYTSCCGNVQIVLDDYSLPPDCLRRYLEENDDSSKHFRKFIRAYNSLMSFTSCGANIQTSAGQGLFSLRIHGEMYHRIDSLLPNEGEPKFLQLYFYETDNELANRQNAFKNLEPKIIEELMSMMRANNFWLKQLMNAKESIDQRGEIDNFNEVEFRIKDFRGERNKKNKDNHPGRYNVPTSSDVAVVIPNDDEATNRDIIIRYRSTGQTTDLRRINQLHRCYDPLAYPLLFPFGDFGWHIGLEKTETDKKIKRTSMSQMDYYSYRFQYREKQKFLFQAGKLFLQFVVDSYAKIEQNRLYFFRANQSRFRTEVYNNLVDAISDQVPLEDIGKSFILPSSHIGSPWNLYQRYLDAMSIVRTFGKPDLFITFTCNPKWDEILENLNGTAAHQRPDIVARVFREKVRRFKNLLKTKFLGIEFIAYIDVIEFQKRGLPHCHFLGILKDEDKLRTTEDYDRIVSAEIPDPTLYPEAYKLVAKCLMHGPCGTDFPSSPCMENGRCSKGYPKEFRETTTHNSNGYPFYKRPNNGRKVQVKRCGRTFTLDNRYVIPHNLKLMTKFNAHINVEICSSIILVKYLYDYVYKGGDKATIEVEQNEIKTYLDARYVSSCEAIWRIFGFSLYNNSPSVTRLDFHLENQQLVTFHENSESTTVITDAKKSKFLSWMNFNKNHPQGINKNFTYIDFPRAFTLKPNTNEWKIREKGDNVIGRLYMADPKQGEKFYLRMMLSHVKGASSFEDLRTVNGTVYETYKEAARAMGLLESDDEWDRCLTEAANFQKPGKFRQLFVQILFYCRPDNPEELFYKYELDLSSDNQRTNNPDDRENLRQLVRNITLKQLNDMLLDLNSRLEEFPNMPLPTYIANPDSRLIAEETPDNIEELLEYVNNNLPLLNVDQRKVFDEVTRCVRQNISKIFFLDGPGGTGKTFLYNLILAQVRSQNRIALAMASSGLAALLLSKGRTAHSRLAIGLNLDEGSVCNFAKNSDLADLLRLCALFIWDESPMTDKKAYETVDRSLRDICNCKNSPFGGKVFLFGGDFRQTLPVVRHGKAEDIINSTLKRSHLWKYMNVRKLTINMRARQQSNENQNEFSQFLLNVGENKLPNDNGFIELPNRICREVNMKNFDEFIKQILPSLSEWTILAPKNDTVDRLNQNIVEYFEGEARIYLSADKVRGDHNPLDFPPEFLNSLRLSGLPSHKLVLKIGSPIMLLRNLNAKEGLCNGTQLKCLSLSENLIEAEILTGTKKGSSVFLHRMTLEPSDTEFPFKLSRRQYPIKPAYAMTINKSQGQTLNNVAIYLEDDVF